MAGSACVHLYTVDCQATLVIHTVIHTLFLRLAKHHNYKVVQVICLTVVK